MTEPSATPIYDQLVREQEQRCPPDYPDDTVPDQHDAGPSWPPEQPS